MIDTIIYPAEKIVRFCRFARDHGFTAGVTETVDSIEASMAVGMDDAAILKLALRSELCSSKEEWDRFEELFERFWNDAPARHLNAEIRQRPEPHKKATSFWVLSGPGTESSQRGPDENKTEQKTTIGAGRLERLRKADFSSVPHLDQAELERMAERLFKQASFRLSRTLKADPLSQYVDLRRTIRRSIATGGNPVELRYKGKKPRTATLVILLDVSGSMTLYSLFLLRFAHALQKRFRKAATFIFSTRLVDITAALRSRKVSDALEALSRKDAGWSGGTKIGESLREFNLRHGRRWLTRDTLLMILSDGWDTGEPSVLASELRAMKQRVKQIIWLNPLLGMDDYRPVTQGMAAALPYVDVFAPAHSLDSLLRLEKTLKRPRRRR